MEEFPFSLELILFNSFDNVSRQQLQIKEKLILHDLKNLLREVVQKFDGRYRVADFELSILSSDERKELRCHWSSLSDSKRSAWSLLFRQGYKYEYFSFQELKEIGKALENELNAYLGFPIDGVQITLNI